MVADPLVGPRGPTERSRVGLLLIHVPIVPHAVWCYPLSP